MQRRNLLIILVAAIVIALVAWAVLASGKSTAPEEAPGGSSGRDAAELSLRIEAGTGLFRSDAVLKSPAN